MNRTLLLLAATLLLCVGADAPASGALRTQDVKAAEPDRTAAGPAHLISLEFPGGPLRAYIRALERAVPTASIALSIDDEEAILPSITLRNVGLSGALAVLDGTEIQSPAGLHRIAIRHITDSDGGLSIQVRQVLHRPSAPPPAAGARGQISPARLSGGPEVVFRAWPLRLYAEHAPVEELLAVIEAAALFADERSEQHTELRYHEPTKMLFVRGLPDRIRLIEETIDLAIASSPAVAEGRAARRRAEESSVAEPRIAELQARIAGLDDTVATLQAQVTDCLTRLRRREAASESVPRD